MGDQKKILLVEDEKDFVTAVTVLLEAHGFKILVAKDGQEGLTMAREYKPDLILLDIMMPRMDGYKMCRMLKFDKKYNSIPVLILTAKAQDQDKIIGIECGADDYLLKSENPDKLVAKVKAILNQ